MDGTSLFYSSHMLHIDYTINDIKRNHSSLSEETHLLELFDNKSKEIKYIDLFCGIGGIRKGFERDNAGCVFSSEIDIHAQYTYYSNYGVVPFGDINLIDEDSIPDHDILCAGFPCQPFSSIGKREGFSHPTQGTMFHEVLRILKSKKPEVVFLENVPGILTHDNGNTLKVILDELSAIGYHCKYHIYDAHDFGVPQKRKRFYLVGFLSHVDYVFPKPPKKYVDIGDYLESDMKGYSISKHLQESYLFKKDDGRPRLIDKDTKGAANTLVSTYHKIQRLTGTFVKDGETGIRLLTANECKSIMGFPEDFAIPVSRTQMYRQMGNSVVIPVIKHIADSIFDKITS